MESDPNLLNEELDTQCRNCGELGWVYDPSPAPEPLWLFDDGIDVLATIDAYPELKISFEDLLIVEDFAFRTALEQLVKDAMEMGLIVPIYLEK